MSVRGRHEAGERRLVLVALLTVRQGREADFESYERRASRVMARYGGRIERRVVLQRSREGDGPDEVHWLSFPDEKAFAAYQEDADLEVLAESRAEAIASTTVWRGLEAEPFGSPR